MSVEQELRDLINGYNTPKERLIGESKLRVKKLIWALECGILKKEDLGQQGVELLKFLNTRENTVDNYSKYLEAQRKLMRAAMKLADEQCGTRTERPEPQTTELIEAAKEFYGAAHILSRET